MATFSLVWALFCVPGSVGAETSGWEIAEVNSADGVPIRYQFAGRGGPSLVFVHGWSCDRTYWREQLDIFAGDHRVVAIDLAGHGESGLDRDEWTIEAFGQDVAAVLVALELDNAVLVGHSMGGPVVVEAALLEPDRVTGVIGVDTLQDPDAPSMSEAQIDGMVKRFEDDFPGSMHALVSSLMFVDESPPELQAWVADDMASGAPEPGAGSLRANLRWHSTRRVQALEALQAPLVLINSPLFPTDLDACVGYGIQVEILPRTGHFLMMESPVEFNSLLASAIEGFVD